MYDSYEESEKWAKTICDDIKKDVMTVNLPRYKIIVQVIIGEMKDQG